MFISQPTSSFADVICDQLQSQETGQRKWQTFEFAVAWVNLLGIERIHESVRAFLDAKGRIRATVGLDFGSTSYEGLSHLLDLEHKGSDITTHVFCDENPACTFHPKVFLFSNSKRAHLYVGSNNMTGAGLDNNVEAALGLAGALKNKTILTAHQTLAAWRNDREESRTRRLTRELLEQLLARRYVLTEKELRTRRSSGRRAATADGGLLFGRSTPRAGRGDRGTGVRGSAGAPPSGSGIGEGLLMRVRPRRNGNQIQISMAVHESFMRGVKQVLSSDGSYKGIGYNEARGGRNGARFEAPDMTAMSNPVARFQWVDSVLQGHEVKEVLKFELFDADSGGVGAQILRRLKEGIGKPPATNLKKLSSDWTVLSKTDQESAQWYRLGSV